VGGPQDARVQVHVTQDLVHGIPFDGVLQTIAAIGVEGHINGVGVAKQVVHVAQDFLVGAIHEEAEQVRAVGVVGRQRQGGLDAVVVHIEIHTAVGVAGNVLQHGAAAGGVVQMGQTQAPERLGAAADI